MAASVARLRTPLARIELAASQLLRVATTPGARALSAGIVEAVAELDDRIAEVLRDLAAALAPPTPADDCRDVVTTLRARMEPVLQARQVAWADAGEPDAGEPIPGPRATVHAAALALVESGLRLAAPGERIALALTTREAPPSCGVAMRVLRAAPGTVQGDAAPAALDAAAFDEPRRIALAHGGLLECTEDETGVGGVVWLEGGTRACAA